MEGEKGREEKKKTVIRRRKREGRRRKIGAMGRIKQRKRERE